MYTIESAPWSEVEALWAAWRTYDLNNPHPRTDISVTKVWVDLVDIGSPSPEKTLVFKEDGEPLACLQVIDFTRHCPQIRLAGIQKVAVKHDYRGNGIGQKLMEVADFYLKENGYELSVLYKSEYTKRGNFYESLGYEPFGDVMLKEYIPSPVLGSELALVLGKIGKF